MQPEFVYQQYRQQLYFLNRTLPDERCIGLLLPNAVRSMLQHTMPARTTISTDGLNVEIMAISAYTAMMFISAYKAGTCNINYIISWCIADALKCNIAINRLHYQQVLHTLKRCRPVYSALCSSTNLQV
jgi:hypothetical protein